MLIGMHTHTHPNSWDSFLTPDEAIDLGKESGLDAKILTEHDWAWNPEEHVALQSRHQDIRVFAGMELNTEDGHVVCLGLHEYVFGMHRAEELATHVARVDGVMIAAHPYRRQMPWRWEKPDDYAESLVRAERNPMYRFVAAMEIVNGRGTLKENTFSVTLANTMGMPGTGADDCHEPKDLGKTATYFEADVKTERELIEAVRSGRFWALDRTGGTKIEDPLYHDVPSDVEHRWAEMAELRRQRHAQGTAEFTGRPEEHPHVRALSEPAS